MLWRLRFDHGDFIDLPLGTSVLGRGERCTIRLRHDSVSREHLKLHVGIGAVVVQDLESSLGTTIDRVRLRGSRAVHDAVALRVGHVHLILTPVADAIWTPQPFGRCPECDEARASSGCAACSARTQRPPPMPERDPVTCELEPQTQPATLDAS